MGVETIEADDASFGEGVMRRFEGRNVGWSAVFCATASFFCLLFGQV